MTPFNAVSPHPLVGGILFLGAECTHIFNDLAPPEKFRKASSEGKRVIDIEFTLDELDTKLNAFSLDKKRGKKQVRKQAIKKALTLLSRRYEIQYNFYTKNPLEYVLDKIFGTKEESRKEQIGKYYSFFRLLGSHFINTNIIHCLSP